MTLHELIGKFNGSGCCASITITGLCEEYTEGLYGLIEEPWYREARDREVRDISIIGCDEKSFEFCIEI